MKKPITSATRWKWTGYIGVLLYALCGLALLLMPQLAADILGYTLAAALCGIGIYNIVAYFRGDTMDSVMGFSFAIGLASLAIGIFLLCSPRALTSFYTFLFGAALVVGGFAKIQMSLDMFRMKAPYWWAMLLASAASLVLGIIIMVQPIETANTIIMFVGISMLVEAGIDLISLIMLHRRIHMAAKIAPVVIQGVGAVIQPEPVPPVATVAPQAESAAPQAAPEVAPEPPAADTPNEPV